jgi:erythromycin esterase-like protein
MAVEREDSKLARDLLEVVRPLHGGWDDFDPLLDLVGDARFVLIGESSHGTHDFYRIRAELTKRLVLERGFQAVAVEGDWPDAYRVNRWVRGHSSERDAIDALADFRRFPAWMWRNADVLDFIGWLRNHNEGVFELHDRVGFYGLDLYSLYASMQGVLGYLDQNDPEAAQRARERYSCFDKFGEDTQAYGISAGFGMTRSCEKEVVNQLIELQRERATFLERDGFVANDEFFFAEQNARVVRSAEQYYRSMFHGRVPSWNLRDLHMADTLDALAAHLGSARRGAKIVVWAHNSHVGDARATEMFARGELNIGQLARERHPGESVLIGFSTFAGSVTAASNWGEPAERKRVRPGLPGSYESLFHNVALPRFLLLKRDLGDLSARLQAPRLQRAIGVIYRPDTERQSHYFTCRLPDQFDAVMHLDVTRAVEPLERSASWVDEVPDTYPTGV